MESRLALTRAPSTFSGVPALTLKLVFRVAAMSTKERFRSFHALKFPAAGGFFGKPAFGAFSKISTRRDWVAHCNGRSKTAAAKANIAVVGPVPDAQITKGTTGKWGGFF